MAWDGTTGLVLEGNTLSGNAGAGLFLDDASALLTANTWSGNAPDLLVQGEACLTPLATYYGVPDHEVCPTWDRPTCDIAFHLNPDVADVDQALPPPPHPLALLPHLSLPAHLPSPPPIRPDRSPPHAPPRDLRSLSS